MNKQKYYEILKPLVDIYDSIEIEMIKDMLDRIDKYDGIKGTLKWYLDKTNELKLFERYNLSVVNKNKKEIKKILEDIIKESSKNAVSIDTLEKYNEHNNKDVKVEDIYKSKSATNLIKEAVKNTESITKLINTKAIESAKQEYVNILNTAYLETSTGIYTYDQSIKRAIDKMAQNGIIMANYDSGRKIGIETAVRRDVITRVNQLVGDIELTTAKEMLETNLVYVDQHLGARTRTKYMKNDYEAHDEWQGKVYMIEGSSDKYPNLYEKTGYKEMLGLKGINCYHDLRPFFEWEKIPEPIDIEKSRKERERLDKQRYYERNIRKLKRQKIVDKRMNYQEDFNTHSKQLSRLSKEYDLWLEKNNKVRNKNREYVSSKTNDDTNKKYVDITKEWIDNVVPNSNVVKDRHYFEHDGIKYKVDGENVVLDYTPDEKETAEWLESTFGGEIYMLPRINKPDGIMTADYLFRNEYWDLKTLTGSGKRILEDSIKKKKRQSTNFIFDITNSEIETSSLFEQLEKLYKSKTTEWIDKVIIKKGNKVIVIYKRNKKD